MLQEHHQIKYIIPFYRPHGMKIGVNSDTENIILFDSMLSLNISYVFVIMELC